jgi:hypothetical protein
MMRTMLAMALGVTLAVGGAAWAKGKDKHVNLTAAHHAMEQAEKKLTAAQHANEYDLGGHAQKAKELLTQALEELKQARETANAHHEEAAK